MQTLLRPFQSFFRAEAASGILLMAAAVAALVWANSPLAPAYADLWETPFTIGGGPLVISKPLLLWVNDGLMAIFFFVVGLEIKREILAGELAEPRKAALALAAAVGGMVVPALVYLAVTSGSGREVGWGMPMATDIAFALGVLALLGSRAPLALKVFLTAVAIVDDLGAVLIIALFYTAELKVGALVWAGVFLAGLVGLNRAGVQKPAWYLLIGVALWVAMLKSGVHATIGGVLLALTIPATRRIDAPAFAERASGLLDVFRTSAARGTAVPTEDQTHAVHELEEACEAVQTPLARLEHALHKPVAFLVMPIFALANAGVPFGSNPGALLGDPASLGALAGLVLGKPVGVVLASLIAVKLGLAVLPAGVRWMHIIGVGFLAGIGFTMSIFIATLAFGSDGAVLDGAKLGVLAASVVSGLLGAAVLLRSSPGPDAPAQA